MESAKQQYLASLKHFCPALTDHELALFVSKLSFQMLQKKEFFIEAGNVQKAIGFIAEGLVRSYYVDPAGDETTVGFYQVGDYATHYHSFLTRNPSNYTIQCLEPTVMACLSYENLQWVYGQSTGFERYGRLVAEEILKRQQARIESFIFQTAEARYLTFIEKHPGLFNRVSLSHLCSYLGIERQTLTRIRQKLAHQ
ncbi:cAMP-binding domain of CRP or a regulatory subunit of cAMP-dependent protein kinases [Dyadobacter soli]|uniref:cAMP-binding domain of CRP or a regulatory subunit of cAMP-dependent protein kinases n=1 Tax=Dyadobacter soli TaxID=659014 RepID=A0A1G7AAY9_9BACT|nr:Crp/Fnr family transcriptional regulator [Dyadobacter soli]SDE12064.1 cAMP-binding domain of CRP or a regulatory subunit of cAMP-dependent protein kinases [Dyadobacter soli]